MSDFDTVLHSDWVVPIAPKREVFTDFSVDEFGTVRLAIWGVMVTLGCDQ